jgi:hypothetical protein
MDTQETPRLNTKLSKGQIGEEMLQRIQRDIVSYSGVLPERVAIAWRGYLAGLIEWGILDVASHDRAVALLPEIKDDPVVDILRGKP